MNALPEFDLTSLRQQFPILGRPLARDRRLVFLDNGASAQKPATVIDKEREVYEQYYANAYRGVYEFGARVDEELERARQLVAAYIGTPDPETVCFTCGATMSLNMVARGWGGRFLQPGDEILVSVTEHHANLVPWQQVARDRGATLRYFPLQSDGQLDLTQLESVLHPRTRIVSLAAVTNVLGTINPLETVFARARDVGAVCVVDAAQSVPHGPCDVTALQADFLVFSGHKLFGPTGVGVLWGRRERLEEMDPFAFGGHMISRVEPQSSTWAPIPAKFEAGTLPIAQAIALGTAIAFANTIDWAAAHTHEDNLVRYGWDALSAVPGLRLLGPTPGHRGPLLSFVMAGAHPEDLAHLLGRQGVFVRHGHHCAMLLHEHLGLTASVRASLAIYNTLADIDALIDGLHYARKRLRLTDPIVNFAPLFQNRDVSSQVDDETPLPPSNSD